MNLLKFYLILQFWFHVALGLTIVFSFMIPKLQNFIAKF